jgi:hypothetical protein
MIIKSGQHYVLREARKDYTNLDRIHNGNKQFYKSKTKTPEGY